MKKLLIGSLALASVSAFANSDESVLNAKAKLVNAINASVSFEITQNDLNDRILNSAAYSDRFHREITKNFGKDCINKSFGSVTELSHLLAQDSLTIESILAPILEKCYP